MWWCVLLLAVVVALCVKIVRLQRSNDEKIKLLLGAVRNGDISLRFPDDRRGSHDKNVNRMLNEISKILHEARKNVATRERFLEVVLNYVDSGIFVYDDSGSVIRHNDVVLKMLDMEVLTHINQLKQSYEALYDVIRELPGEHNERVKLLIGKREVSVTVNCSRLQIGDVNYTIITLADIDRHLDAQEVDAWNKLTRVLIHEIMNSLTPVISISETMMKCEMTDSEAVKEGVTAINGISQDLLNFVRSYREFAQLPPPVPTIFEVKEFLERMTVLGRQYMVNSNVDIVVDECDDGLMLYADESQVARVCLNIIKNGIESIGEHLGGIIRLTAYTHDGNNVKIEISNNGPVIPENERENVFVPFYTTKQQGNGVGLSLSRSIMKANGGSLYLKSYDEDSLTVFVLTFDA